jgi:hypothetical protein
MASTITPANLTVTVTESVTLNGAEENATNTLVIASVAQVSRRIYTVDNADYETLIELTSGRISGQKYDIADCKYVRVTNLDNTNTLHVRIVNSNSENYTLKVAAGHSLMFGPDFKTGAGSGAAPVTFYDISKIEAVADPSHQDVDCELYVASA